MLKLTSLALAAALAGFAPAPLYAQSTAAPSSGSSRWAPWIGCWQMMQESLDDGSSTIARLLGLPAPTTSPSDGARICVSPAGAAGATMVTLVNNQRVLTETIVADGSQQPLSDPGCRGWQRNEWSQLGSRLFATAEVACAEQPSRKVSGMAMMIAGPTWVDIQMIESEGKNSLRVRRYRRTANPSESEAVPGTARQAAAAPLGLKLSIADVKEAAGKVAPEVLQAALLELRSGFDLNGKTLIDLDNSGVPRGVIDLMVALSYPQRFIVERPSGGYAGMSGMTGPLTWGYYNGFDEMWPYYSHPYLYTSYYAPFGYRYWGYYDNFYFSGPGFVVINPGPSSGGGLPPNVEPSGEGRVVDGRGYTRIRRNEPEPGRFNGNNGSSGGYSTASSGSGSSSSGSSGSSGVSSSGYSGGGGGGERTAQPRPPGGN
jgi:hypothetical protein